MFTVSEWFGIETDSESLIVAKVTNGERDIKIRWRVGSHTANVFDESGREIDCFTFAWAKDEAAEFDFRDSALSWIDSANTVEEW
jgi:hypothetical protein